MRVILSKSLEDNFRNFVVVSNAAKVRDLKGVTTLIIHDFSDSEFSIGVLLSEFKENGIKYFVYISEQPSKSVESAVIGAGGVVITDTFYFEDEEELEALIEDIEDNESTTSLVSTAESSVEILKNFMQSVDANDKRVFLPAYQDSVNDAIVELEHINKKNELIINSMGESILETYKRAGDLIQQYSNQTKMLTSKMEELQQAQANSGGSGQSFSNSVAFYTSVRYTGIARVLLVREYSPCRYLTSFITAYRHHLQYEKNLRSRLVFAVQKGKGVLAKYNDVVSITENSSSLASLFTSDVVVTNTPKKDIMLELAKNSVEVVIYVDRLYGSQDIVSGRVKKVNAVSGFSDLARYGLNANETICSVNPFPDCLTCLRPMKDYPTERDGRLAVYCKGYAPAYAKLDNILGIKG